MQINFKQLTFAREYRGITQTDLASKIRGLSQSNLSKFEKGIGSLSEDVIDRIIDYLGFPKEFYEKKIYNLEENSHYRRKKGITKGEKSQIEYSNKIIGYLLDQMSESIVFPDMQFQTIDLEEGFTPEYAADFTRRFLGLKDEPVRNINTLLEENGIIIKEVNYDVDIFDGVSIVTDQGAYVIIVNNNFSNDHKRFTIAHELGHIIMHVNNNYLIPEHRDKEKEANAFASQFLMPSQYVKNSLNGLKIQYLAELKKYWLTSMASIVRRAKDLGCIDQNKYLYFNIELSRKGYKKKEPIDVYIDHPSLFNEAYKIHKSELEYSDEDLSKAFALPIDVLTKFFQQSNLRLKMKIS